MRVAWLLKILSAAAGCLHCVGAFRVDGGLRRLSFGDGSLPTSGSKRLVWGAPFSRSLAKGATHASLKDALAGRVSLQTRANSGREGWQLLFAAKRWPFSWSVCRFALLSLRAAKERLGDWMRGLLEKCLRRAGVAAVVERKPSSQENPSSPQATLVCASCGASMFVARGREKKFLTKELRCLGCGDAIFDAQDGSGEKASEAQMPQTPPASETLAQDESD